MLFSSAKFTILISWSPIYIPLIILSVLMKMASTSIAITYDLFYFDFILILDSILVYHVNQL